MKKVKVSLITITLITIIIISFLYLSSCDEGPTEPGIEPGRRDYTWEVDTLKIPFTYLIKLWGSSPNNIWAVGPSDESINSLWHYDGKTWEKTTQRLSSNLQSIFGFDSSHIWACDSPGGNIFHYNGVSWKKAGFFPYPDYSLTYLNDIWGPDPNEIYMAGAAYDQGKGTKAILMDNDRSDWKYVDIPDQEWSFMAVRKSVKNNLLYLTAVDFNKSEDRYKIFTYDGKNLEEIYSGGEVVSVNEMNEEIYLCIGQTIYKHNDKTLEVWKDFSGSDHAGTIYGRNEKDVFTKGKNGITHFDGIDLVTLYETNMTIFDVLVFEKDIFILCLGNGPVIIHGKLKDK
jgi:hypothetical protein